MILVIISVAILILMVAGLILFKSAEQKRKEAEEMRKILETPVGGMAIRRKKKICSINIQMRNKEEMTDGRNF